MIVDPWQIFLTFDEASQLLKLPLEALLKRVDGRFFYFRGFAVLDDQLDTDPKPPLEKALARRKFINGVIRLDQHYSDLMDIDTELIKAASDSIKNPALDEILQSDGVSFLVDGGIFANGEPILRGYFYGTSDCVFIKPQSIVDRCPHLSLNEIEAINAKYRIVDLETFAQVRADIASRDGEDLHKVAFRMFQNGEVYKLALPINTGSAIGTPELLSSDTIKKDHTIDWDLKGEMISPEAGSNTLEVKPQLGETANAQDAESSKRTNNLLRTIGALVYLLIKHTHVKYKHGNKPNKSQIAKAIKDELEKLGIRDKGQSPQNMSIVIREALELIDNERQTPN